MESPRKFNDCYFYYYSTCTKGDNCVFRHEPSALGCETMCTAWQQGKCLDKRCKLRHMELRKNRKQIPCYWENQPGGCRKKHCPFMHKNPDARTDGIAPAQPVPQQPAAAATAGSAEAGEQPAPAPAQLPAPAPAPAPVPLLWQQQRQVVLDSAILGVLPASSELLGARRVLHAHPLPHEAHAHAHAPHAPHAHAAHAHAHAPHAHAPSPYAPLPVDPLVVNFEEESDNESAPSSTPTKRASPGDSGGTGGGGTAPDHELLLLERIQAEAAAFYSYEAPPPAPAPAASYERLSLDDIAARRSLAAPLPATTATRTARAELDFKVLSLDEIRARKKAENSLHGGAPITLNLSRKRKLSTQETVTTAGGKIIKLVRSNSIVYRKVDAPATPILPRTDHKQNETNESTQSRKRTISECDIYDMQDDELVDDCFEFKRIKIPEQPSKPKLIRNRHLSSTNKVSLDSKEDERDTSAKTDDDSDSEVQIVSVELADRTSVDLSDSGVVDLESAKMGEPVDIVDLSDDHDSDVVISDSDLDLGGNNVPDVVASCQKSKVDSSEKELLQSIDDILDRDL